MAPACQIPINVLDMDAATDPVIATVCDYWCSLNGGRPPPRKAFDFMAVYKAAPHLLMAERIGPGSFKFIYCGTFVANNFPLDLMGKTFTPQTARMSRVNWPGFFTETLDTPCLRYGREPVDWPNDEYGEIIYGTFPLTDEQGRGSHSLGCLVFVKKSPYAREM